MNKTKRPSKGSLLVNIVGTLGYIVCLLQWLWTVVLFVPLLKQSQLMDLFTPQPSTPEPSRVIEATSEPSVVITVIAVAITVAVLALTIYALSKIPATIGKTGHKLTHDTAAKFVVPAITRHQKLPAKQKRRLTIQVSFILKAILLLIPLGLALLAPIGSLPLPYDVILVSAGFLAGTTGLLFALQLLLIKLMKPPVNTVW